MKKFVLLVIFFTFKTIYPQQQEIDSLQKLISVIENDSLKLSYYHNICVLCDIKDNFKYGTQALKLIEELDKKASNISKIRLLKHKAEFNDILFIYYQNTNDIKKQYEIKQQQALIYYDIKDTVNLEGTYSDIIDILFEQKKTNDAFELATKRLNKYEKSKSLNYVAFYQSKLGALYDKINYYDKMVEYYQKNLNTNIKINDLKGVAFAHSLLARAYYYNHKPQMAIEHSLKSLHYFEKENNKRAIFRALLETSSIYTSLRNFNKSIELSNQALMIAVDFKDSSMVSNVLFGRISIYTEMKDYTNAIAYGKRWYNISVIENNGFNMLNAGILISRNCLNMNQINEATKYIHISDSIAEVSKDIYALRNLYEIKFVLNSKKKKFELALENRLQFEKLNDSIRILENHSGLEKNEMISEFEKAQSKIKDEQLIKDQKAQIERNKQNNIIISVSSGLIIVLVLLIMIFKNYKQKQKSNLVLSQRNEEIIKQKRLVEEKHKEITDSINYAERIQRSFLATQTHLDGNINKNTGLDSARPDNYFIFFQPKDVVSGDFYWSSTLLNGNFALATADSTGHGVPGAIMSLLNITSLEKAIETETSPDKILNLTRTIIIERLKKDGSADGGKDGMDCSVCVYDFNNKKLFIAAAHNPVWIVRTAVISSGVEKDSDLKNGLDSARPDIEVIEIKPDKMPVGKHDRQDIPFTLHEIDLQEGDVVYTLTDGFTDQFGGEKGKKYMSKNLRELLAANAHLPMSEQKELLQKTFSDWKGSLEQIDDVTVIGVRI